MNEDSVQISARVPSDLVAALERAAEASDRSLSAELRRAIKQYLAESGSSAQTHRRAA
jgi:predicted transcriptional regulator